MLDFCKDIECVVDGCVRNGERCVFKRQDESGNVIRWLEAEWIECPEDSRYEVVQVLFCFVDTGNEAYGVEMKDTRRERKM